MISCRDGEPTPGQLLIGSQKQRKNKDEAHQKTLEGNVSINNLANMVTCMAHAAIAGNLEDHQKSSGELDQDICMHRATKQILKRKQRKVAVGCTSHTEITCRSNSVAQFIDLQQQWRGHEIELEFSREKYVSRPDPSTIVKKIETDVKIVTWQIKEPAMDTYNKNT